MPKHKILPFVLLFIFVTSLHAGRVSVDTACLTKCCLQTNLMGMHHAMGQKMKSTLNCHSKIPSIPCDLQSKKTVKIPECTLTTSCSSFPNTIGPIEVLSNLGLDNSAVQGNYLDQAVAEKLHSPPIYLQIRSLLI
jgi:hypothetical protein